ncbi:MAG: type VI secretion system tube protein Hcp [Proteobacteria bacterium]|nr:type VI secretion system tube protein Hcp [Pseudomonadota bacterium]
MATDYFLKLDDIKGESADDKHKGEIDLTSFSWGATQAGSPQGGGQGTAKASVQDLHFTHYLDKASPDLQKVLLSGKHIPKGVLVARKAGDKPLEYLKIEMKDIMVTSVQYGASHGGDTMPSEQVSLSFAHFTTTYTPQKADGSGDTPADVKYDIKANKLG